MPGLYLFLLLLLPFGSAVAASLEMARLNTYAVEYRITEEVEGCKPQLMAALHKNLINITLDRSRADAIYHVKIELRNASGLRKQVFWSADLYSRDKKLLFSAEGEEGGWTMRKACQSAAEDIADALGDEVRDARVNRADMPMPKVKRPIRPKPVVTYTDDEVNWTPRHEIGEREIAIQPEPILQQATGDSIPMGPGKWRESAWDTARLRGCSGHFSRTQVFPNTDTEIYTTQCGSKGEAKITCTAQDCILTY